MERKAKKIEIKKERIIFLEKIAVGRNANQDGREWKGARQMAKIEISPKAKEHLKKKGEAYTVSMIVCGG